MKQFEYQTLMDMPPWETEHTLNSYGGEGWELVSAVPINTQSETLITLFLKREVVT